MATVSPIVRGEFLYQDVLLVDVGGESRRHPRAPESEIQRLLAGDIKDQVGHWWEAQLIHYGLKRTKDKNAAKVRLQQALAQGKLQNAPPHLVDMEKDMKKDYQSAIRRASKVKPESANVGKRKRGDQSEATSGETKISIRVGNVAIDIDQSGPTSSKKRKSASTSTTDQTASKKAKTPATADRKPSTSSKKTPSSTANSAAPRKTKQAKPSQDHPENVVHRSSSTSKSKATKREADIKRSPPPSPPPSTKSDPNAPRATPSINPAPTNKPTGYLFDSDAMDTRADISRDQINVTGVYALHCPQVAEQLPELAHNFCLRLAVDHESGLAWGAFDLAMKSSVIKMDQISIGSTMTFGWRARDSWEGSLRFGRACHGEMVLDGRGGVRGVIHSLFNESCEFEAKRKLGPLWCGRSISQLQKEWDGFPKEAYGR
jgi:hypothetical protein